MTRLFGKAWLSCCRLPWQFCSTPPRKVSALPSFQLQQRAGENASRQYRQDASGETGATFGFWETDDDNRAKLRHLIEIREQFDLIMIGA